MFDLSILTPFQIGFSLAVGILLGLAYLIILWRTLLYLPKVKKKGNFLFVSAVIRLFLIIFVALYFSYNNGARFLLIFIGFIITRLIVLRYIKNNVLNTLSSRIPTQKPNKNSTKNRPEISKSIANTTSHKSGAHKRKTK